MCIEFLIDNQWDQHLEQVKNVDCRRAAIAICRNVPLYLHDRMSFICPDHQIPNTNQEHDDDENAPPVDQCPLRGQVELLWCANDNKTFIPFLKGAKQGKDRELYIAELEEFAQAFEQDRKQDLEKIIQNKQP